MEKFKGYDVVERYPERGWLKGYFYVSNEDILGQDQKNTQAYRDLSALRHKDLVLHLLDIEKGDKLIDVGCEVGAIMVYCGLLGAEVSGIDLCVESVEQANKYMKEFSINGKAIAGDARNLPFPDNYFDKAVSSDFFEHLNYDDKIISLKELMRVIKPSGKLLIKTPNLTYLRTARLIKQLNRTLKLKNPFKVIIPHTHGEAHQHIGLSSRKKLIAAIKAAGFINFRCHFSLNSKVERVDFGLAELLSEIPLIRDLVTEELIIEVYKPVIISLFP
ncbi:MAG: class I SAM-dependent methyltransferase [Candidatus Omnitrophica bacterium]|jgi:2-polyprenyl-3-methyl-5-hydroxy-6-metoxy-1,4-benzoquinol methylase|nr:class I SAM-dependent methyltransferase [Candidatus Omnitrophota bacterium]